jgi:hypothetical protein
MHAARGRQTSPDIEELPDAGFASQEPDRTPQEITVLPRGDRRAGLDFKNLIGRRPVSGEIVFPAKQVIIHP